MTASANDKFKKLSKRWVGQIGSAGVSDASVQTIPLASVTNLPTDTAVVAVIDRVDANGTTTPGTEETIIGVVSGSNLITSIRGAEGTAQAHNAGAVVEILVTAIGWNDLIDGLLIGHNQDGSHGASAIVASNISASAITQGALNFTVATSDGWIADSNTWTYSSVDGHTFVVTVNADVTGSIQRGDKVKFTNNSTTFYGIVTKTPTFSLNTSITLYGGTTYSVANSAITSPYYSHTKAPFGFNTDPLIWTETLSDTSNRDQSNPTASTWYNLGTLLLAIPIGAWDLSYSLEEFAAYQTAATTIYMSSALSTSNSSVSDADLRSDSEIVLGSGTNSDFAQMHQRRKHILLTSKTSYYLIAMTASTLGGTGVIRFQGASAPSRITAICAFL